MQAFYIYLTVRIALAIVLINGAGGAIQTPRSTGVDFAHSF
jgi:hypothetical protein